MTDDFTNELRLKAVAKILGTLANPFVFVGGAVVSLYAPRNAAPEQRPTDDVDVVVELASYGGYARLDERLREIGFQNDVTSSVICRYRVQGIVVDVMPTEPEILGFSNRWYPEGFHLPKITHWTKRRPFGCLPQRILLRPNSKPSRAEARAISGGAPILRTWICIR